MSFLKSFAIIAVTASGISLAGCGTIDDDTKNRALKAAALGAVTGGIIGAYDANWAAGAAIGAAAGAGVGYVYDQIKKDNF